MAPPRKKRPPRVPSTPAPAKQPEAFVITLEQLQGVLTVIGQAAHPNQSWLAITGLVQQLEELPPLELAGVPAEEPSQ